LNIAIRNEALFEFKKAQKSQINFAELRRKGFWAESFIFWENEDKNKPSSLFASIFK